ncbi:MULTISPECIES: DMT family transporter [Pseudonocardia]|uniref:DMT family transporter n=1 Tax=Pseudonocardia TaxID=1847 RepID=UPI001AD753DC|nr:MULTISPECIES: multidrug efflux SMR transporter [Pseudonocardia]MBO4239234.1 QacE family quaternary ammonium compound efflux SMR transporter [Pseudonocardia alni]
MPYLLLAGAIVLEVVATINLRLSEGFTRLVPAVLVVIGYVGAFGLLSQVLQAGVPVGLAYGIWAAAGVALVAVIGAVFLGDTLTPVQFGGIALVIAGVLALELGAAH